MFNFIRPLDKIPISRVKIVFNSNVQCFVVIPPKQESCVFVVILLHDDVRDFDDIPPHDDV